MKFTSHVKSPALCWSSIDSFGEATDTAVLHSESAQHSHLLHSALLTLAWGCWMITSPPQTVLT